MAHTDTCKMEVLNFVKKIKEAKGCSINAACQEAFHESDGIPAETIRRWWKEAQKETEELVKNDQLPTTDANPSENPEKQENQQVVDKAKQSGPGRSKKHEPAPAKEAPRVYATFPPLQALRLRVQQGGESAGAAKEAPPVYATFALQQAARVVEQLKIISQGDPKYLIGCQTILTWFSDQPKLRELLISICPVCGSKGAEQEVAQEVVSPLTQGIEAEQEGLWG